MLCVLVRLEETALKITVNSVETIRNGHGLQTESVKKQTVRGGMTKR